MHEQDPFPGLEQPENEGGDLVVRSAEGSSSDPFFLFIGTLIPEGASSKLKAGGIRYVHKKLDSTPENWALICEFVEDDALIGVVGKLSGRNFDAFLAPTYEEVSRRLLAGLAQVPHLLLLHETLVSLRPDEQSEDEEPPDEEEDEDSYYAYVARKEFFYTPPVEVRERLINLLDEHRLSFVPYETNAELSVLAASFVEDSEKHLLFRIYVPAGRIFADEADRVLNLFRDWLTRVKGRAVREDGYSTGSGQIYEFFGDQSLTSSELSVEFSDFSRFLDLCVDDPSEASKVLTTSSALDARDADKLVTRYGKEGRRLQLDLRQTRESKLLEIKHRLETELVDDLTDRDRKAVDGLVDALVPGRPNVAGILHPASADREATPRMNVNIENLNQQVVQAVECTVIQSVEGTVNLSHEGTQLLDLIYRFGDRAAGDLETAVHELEDKDSNRTTRLGARQRLKGFLLRLGGKAEDAVIQLLLRYLEDKVGL